MSETAIGVVGLGLMGGSMAKHLVDDGFDVVGFDVSDEALATVTEYGASAAESPADVAGRSDVVITSLPNPDIVEAAYTGEDGVFAGAGDGLIALEMSTSTPATTRTLAERAPDAVDIVDSPVDGGPEDCREGTLVILNGGDRDVIDGAAVRETLDSLSKKRFYAGQLGSGHMVKLLNNTLAVGNLLLATEIAALGVEAGVEGERLLDLLTNMSGSSNQLEKRLPRVLNRNFEAGFSTDLAKKDVGLLVDAGREENVPVTGASYVHQMMVRASAEGYSAEDMCAMVKLFEDAISQPVEAEADVDESFDGY